MLVRYDHQQIQLVCRLGLPSRGSRERGFRYLRLLEGNAPANANQSRVRVELADRVPIRDRNVVASGLVVFCARRLHERARPHFRGRSLGGRGNSKDVEEGRHVYGRSRVASCPFAREATPYDVAVR